MLSEGERHIFSDHLSTYYYFHVAGVSVTQRKLDQDVRWRLVIDSEFRTNRQLIKSAALFSFSPDDELVVYF